MLTLAAVVVAWLKGGHPERLGAVTTLVVFAVSFYTHELRVGAFYAGDAVVDFLMTGLFVWLALTRDRWWALVMSAIMTLTLLVYVSALVVPDLGAYAVLSARIGLGILASLTLLCGAGERWLVGERAVSDREAWVRRARSRSRSRSGNAGPRPVAQAPREVRP
ncbi:MULTISPECIES: hypothetical protein [unclassified Brevundimonas]|uniref:hypothetical protein n=1 Tax=unclassified Brevundimonas TaxID=2622653 RepID=UPI0006F5D0CC|nr:MULTISPECIES: hypothetical protein [unclassified Brevundimonas]KQY79265.1 hypothetical protein ASD25_26230 [Brevundimonas sp. Root1423]KRA21969.1 hypothetical protein ASD59_10420 [Brevundimonas sp. Root608]